MASKGPRSKLDHETRARRQKALEAPREPPRPKTHWDHVLEEMVWLSKDFEAERKWKLALAKKVAIRVSKSMGDHASRGEKKVKEGEQRLRKIALNISKDVKKFWMKIEKLVLYKHQLELEERKKRALDKQLNFLLGQTERYSTMLAENLVNVPLSHKTARLESETKLPSDRKRGVDEGNLIGSTERPEPRSDNADGDYGIQSQDESEDDEHTIVEDEALITEEERREELEALQNEMDLPLEELLKRYTKNKVSREGSPGSGEDVTEAAQKAKDKFRCKKDVCGTTLLKKVEGKLLEGALISSDSSSELPDLANQGNGSLPSKLLEKCLDADNVPACEENHLPIGRKIKSSNSVPAASQFCGESSSEFSKLEDQISITKTCQSKLSSKGCTVSDEECLPLDSVDELDDRDYVVADGEEKDDETTLLEEEELAKEEPNDPLDEIKLLQQENEMTIEELLARYKKDSYTEEDTQTESEYASTSSEEQAGHSADCDIELETRNVSVDDNDDDAVEQGGSVEAMARHNEVKLDNNSEEGRESENIIADAAAAARSAQPTGNTFSTTKVRTKFPFLIKHPLREYQHIGLDWLVTMYEKRLNGILADEMGLGKTIMTISLLAHLACEKGIWGQHLIVVPTSVMLNWETEFLKWCPAFKILTYFGSAKERKFKRQGWLKPNSFHVCITTYRLVIQDSKAFKRKKWKYLILDEAHLIKNWKSQRWQTLLNFNSKRRILLTGTPLQNDLMELWSLMHFLMPHIFQSHQEFKDWFSNPISGMVEGQEKVNKEVVDRLHNVLRPFILRRLKRDVEKQLPKKYEHVIYCRLSKRQRNLYEDFIASSETQATLASGSFFGMISVIMQLRKVCNHPDLFEGRPIISSFDMVGIDAQLSSLVCTMLSSGPFSEVDLRGLSILFTHLDFNMTSWEVDEVTAIATPSSLFEEVSPEPVDKARNCHRTHDHQRKAHGTNIFEEIQKALQEERMKQARERAASIAWWNSLQCRKKPVYGTNLRELATIKHPVYDIHQQKRKPSCYMNFSSKLADIVLLPEERSEMMLDLIESFMFAIPAARAPSPDYWCSKSGAPVFLHPSYKEKCTEALAPLLTPIRPAIVRRQVYFPDRRLIQFDCGKLQELAVLLRRLKSEGHRALIFTQMTKMLDILEAFINLYGYTYMRLDGSTQPEERQTLMQRFNTNPKFFLFILSTRSGGVGINLVGADTVIFYDSDWNPAMDQQAQDRCHRIGQTREVHIYRLISESTIEENILKKANQKRALDDLVIQSGSYNTEFFKKLDPMELFSGHGTLPVENLRKGSSTAVESSNGGTEEVLLSNADVEAALKHAEDEADYMALKKLEQEEAVENQEFTEDAIGRLEDDEIGIEDDVKPDDKITEEQTGSTAIVRMDVGATSNGGNLNEERALTLATEEDDVDMLADVKQMAAAAAAAGQASSSFENQLRPIDRYAMRFLDLWDPIIDKSAIEPQVAFEEAEWELDHIEKFKEDLEAENDEDEEPLLYERWDADFATEAYRQQVEALAQRQLMEDLESEAKEMEDADNERDESNRNEAAVERKPKKSKKKTKKTKFKSLKKGALASEPEELHKELPIEQISVDDKAPSPEALSPDTMPHSPPIQKKRKKSQTAPEEEKVSKKSSKKLTKATESSPMEDSSTSDKQHVETKKLKSGDRVTDLDSKLTSRSKMGGKISITFMPVKRVLTIKSEKLKKRGNVWSRDCIPSPDSWSSQEDAILCAIVHEYSTHWSLVSDTLYGMTAGGYYRGRFRHPAHCCERFRELFFKYISSTTTDHPNNEKISSAGPGKALLKVTEDNVRTLLDVASELPDNELLIQKHFTAILSSVWRAKMRSDRHQSMSSSRNGFYSTGRYSSYATSRISGKSRTESDKMKMPNLGQSSKVAAVLNGANRAPREDSLPPSSRQEAPAIAERLELTLEFGRNRNEWGTHLPSVINMSVWGSDPPRLTDEPRGRSLLPESSCNIAENRCRMASNSCSEGEGLGWALSAFPTCDVVRSRPGSKSQPLGKHKAASDSIKPMKSSKLLKTMEPNESPTMISKLALPSPVTASKSPILSPNPPLFAAIPENDDLDPFFPGVDSALPEAGSSESVPYEYDPNFITGLEDWKSLHDDIMDIG
ncbi:protein PHOTOPERIOD-INDEPENDENT EARLY FLOWERING 1-like isoform X2 [Magnolia sinica]|uniref:protein PHOTOPERIOD-INDEPENDENT EARLY FLOWERING 1-like isoform X2 n=1 Tax=Magnolia sinica TaxID=86752 RepID=UPI00265B6CD6|nr:protein PHOTOPERIOD-INDEPENDENT EARLY FLOWERING 1-like isoform X2 [Magnolia sinica]